MTSMPYHWPHSRLTTLTSPQTMDCRAIKSRPLNPIPLVQSPFNPALVPQGWCHAGVMPKSPMAVQQSGIVSTNPHKRNNKPRKGGISTMLGRQCQCQGGISRPDLPDHNHETTAFHPPSAANTKRTLLNPYPTNSYQTIQPLL